MVTTNNAKIPNGFSVSIPKATQANILHIFIKKKNKKLKMSVNSSKEVKIF